MLFMKETNVYSTYVCIKCMYKFIFIIPKLEGKNKSLFPLYSKDNILKFPRKMTTAKLGELIT